MNAATPLTSVEPAQGERDTHARPKLETDASAARANLPARPLAAVLTAFWTYVALSNVLYAHSMSLATDPDGKHHFFADWNARVLQHLILYPVLLGCVWISLRVGWRPLRRAIPVQLALGLGFAALASPVLGCCEWLVGEGMTHRQPWSMTGLGKSIAMSNHHDLSTWIASATSFLLTYGFALALVTGFALYRRFKESEVRRAALERAWSGARLAALRMQLSPHTLFNLLHTIRGQIAWDPAAARQMVVQLGDLLRKLLAAGERDLSPLAEEIEFARLYLELQRQRFADRLSLELPDPGTLPHTWVPSLILQPLIENAVVHGLADHGGLVMIRVHGQIAGGLLHLSVVNTIADSRTGEPSGGSRASGGIGLRNVRERLAVQFGNRAVLEAGARTESPQWVAEIHMPLVMAPF
ncbi:MAG TPA: histidine kinase [Steroidobacteraceae bacterium]|nr:histidine kinase [Steroidobacteraceae bacterium]